MTHRKRWSANVCTIALYAAARRSLHCRRPNPPLPLPLPRLLLRPHACCPQPSRFSTLFSRFRPHCASRCTRRWIFKNRLWRWPSRLRTLPYDLHSRSIAMRSNLPIALHAHASNHRSRAYLPSFDATARRLRWPPRLAPGGSTPCDAWPSCERTRRARQLTVPPLLPLLLRPPTLARTLTGRTWAASSLIASATFNCSNAAPR